MLGLDWHSIFSPELPLTEVILRGTIVYLFLFIVLRLMRHQAGALNITDLLLVVVIADAAQNAMGKDYKSVTEGAVLVATMAAWDFALDWLGYHFPKTRRFIRPEPLPLIQDGMLLRRNMRRALVTEDELMTQLREQGVRSPEQVKRCVLEGDGHISVIKKED
ncbi:MAG TPA: YetF domain-containing protein [Gammaproteobacteria bacterium]|nr:YetF domain-containing protein [Gammaproteobacteria bacterium]